MARVSFGVERRAIAAACAASTERISAPSPLPSFAETKCVSAKFRKPSFQASSTFMRSRAALSALSHLFTASTIARPRSST